MFPSVPDVPELWGGPECTVNRVRDNYFDQIERSGHAARPDDLDRFAELGIRTLRFPVLWERTAPHGLEVADWSWPDRGLGRLRELGITPIVGLVHHGSGPRSTSLTDPSFPERLAEYAEAVARRYPWVEHYTPVNEPLTTARFSGLYGHWYPHEHHPSAFARALLHQCRGVVLAMERIRRINPRARLIQTEDLAKVFSTDRLAYQAEFENERRWLTFDLLGGRVRRGHPLWLFLRRTGFAGRDLEWLADHPCPPDVIGVNYYLTSERFLDHRLGRYPASLHGGNGRHRYVDVEAVRVRVEGMAGPEALLAEVAARYDRPVAVTEVHNGCTREEQMRWLLEVWDAAVALRRRGRDIRAVTAWALLGTYDWNTLVTRAEGHYEPGVFDVRVAVPRPTALAGMVRALAGGRRPGHPVLESPGWWHRPERLTFHGADARPLAVVRTPPSAPAGAPRPLLITGATGILGRALARQAAARGLAYRLLDRSEMDIADRARVEEVLAETGAWALVNAAGYVRVDAAERDRERCFRENSDGPAVLAEACRDRGVRLVTFSTDLVFGGAGAAPYDEGAAPAPLNAYGASKAEGERRVLGADPSALVVRTSAFFGPHDEHNFVTLALRRLAAGQRYPAAEDLVVTPTYVPHLVDATLDLLIDGERGLWHLTTEEPVTWATLARRAALAAGLDPAAVDGRPGAALSFAAPRPANSALRSRRGRLTPTLDQALACYVAQCGRRWETKAGSFEEPEVARALEA